MVIAVVCQVRHYDRSVYFLPSVAHGRGAIRCDPVLPPAHSRLSLIHSGKPPDGCEGAPTCRKRAEVFSRRGTRKHRGRESSYTASAATKRSGSSCPGG